VEAETPLSLPIAHATTADDVIPRNKYLERAALLPREAATRKVFGHAWCSRQASTPAADGLQSSQGLARECVEVRIRTIAAASNGAAREGLAVSQIRFAAVERP
jgi:hypothetical protein